MLYLPGVPTMRTYDKLYEIGSLQEEITLQTDVNDAEQRLFDGNWHSRPTAYRICCLPGNLTW